MDTTQQAYEAAIEKMPPDVEFVTLWAKDVEETRKRERLFVNYVRSLGARCALRNDGWIDRENNKFQIPSYAYFNDGIREGDLVAIGSPYNFKMAVITEIKKTWWRTKYYHFRIKR